MKAVWKGTTVAESEVYVKVEGFYYFPVSSVKKEYLRESNYQAYCPWKGTASFFSVEINGVANRDAIWYYPTPSDRADYLKGYVGFWKGIIMLE